MYTVTIRSWNTVPSEAKHCTVWMRSTKAVVIFIVRILLKWFTAEDFTHALLTQALRIVWLMTEGQS